MTLITQDTIKRIAKTVGEVAATFTAVEAAVPHAPSVAVGGVVVGGSGVAALLLNVAIQWFTQTKSARLDKLAAAIDSAVDARLAAQVKDNALKHDGNAS